MILDERNEFADAVSVAAAAGTALIGDQIPLSVARDIGNGQPVYWVVTIDTEVITGGAAGTLTFQLVSDATAAIATNGSATVHAQSQAFVTDGTDANDPKLKAGEVAVCMAVPLEGAEYEGFLGVLAVTATTTTTAGAINSFLTLDPTGWKAYPDAEN